MTQNRSFKDYVANRFYNELYNAVSSVYDKDNIRFIFKDSTEIQA